MNKYTQGPWAIVPSGTGEVLIAGGRSPDPITEARNLFVAHVMRAPEESQEPTWFWLTHEEAQANALLIASAPDLLEALEFALSELESITTDEFSNGADQGARDRMTEAIRKAKGGE